MLEDAWRRFKTLEDAWRRFNTLEDAWRRLKTLEDAWWWLMMHDDICIMHLIKTHHPCNQQASSMESTSIMLSTSVKSVTASSIYIKRCVTYLLTNWPKARMRGQLGPEILVDNIASLIASVMYLFLCVNRCWSAWGKIACLCFWGQKPLAYKQGALGTLS